MLAKSRNGNKNVKLAGVVRATVSITNRNKTVIPKTLFLSKSLTPRKQPLISDNVFNALIGHKLNICLWKKIP